MWLNDTVLPAVNLLPGWFHVPVSHICLEAAPGDEQLNLRTDVHFVHLSQRIVTHQNQHSICLCAVLPYNSFDWRNHSKLFSKLQWTMIRLFSKAIMMHVSIYIKQHLKDHNLPSRQGGLKVRFHGQKSTKKTLSNS